MPKALPITRDDNTAAELREAAMRGNDADATRRMLALALVLEGYKRGEAGKLRGIGPADLARLGFHATTPNASPGSATAWRLDRNHGSLHIGRRQ